MAKSMVDYCLRTGWLSVLIIILIELAFSYSIPSLSLQDHPVLKYFVEVVQNIAPIIGKIDERFSDHPGTVQVYLAATLILLIPKTWAMYLWLAQKGGGQYDQLVVSPQTKTHAGNVGKWVAEPLSSEARKASTEQRSWASRIIWSILTLAFTAGMAVVTLVWGSPNSSNEEILKDFYYLGAGGIVMWLYWSVKGMVFLAFLFAISIAVLRGYLSYFKQRFQK